MSWAYRIFKDRRDGLVRYTIREIYYRKNGKPWLYSEEPQFPEGATAKELVEDLEMMLKDAKRGGVLAAKDFK